MRIFPASIASGFILLVSASCTDTCPENKNALPLAGFYASGESNESITVDSLEVYGPGAPDDAVLSEGDEAKERLFLPFRIDSDTTRYVFRDCRKGSTARDTVTFIYSRTPRFVNVECGVSYLFGIKEISCQGVLIDSVTCPQGFIDNTNSENLHIYFSASNAES